MDWITLRFLLDGDIGERPIQSLVSSNPFSLGPDIFVHNAVEFMLPSPSDHLFTSEGLSIERFIEALKMCNHTRQRLLHLEVVQTAVEQFAQRHFPGAVIEQFLAQVSQRYEHSMIASSFLRSRPLTLSS